MYLTKGERELIITWTEADEEVELYTTSRIAKAWCDKAGFELRTAQEGEGKVDFWIYYCPVKEFRLGKKKKLNLSEEQRAKRAEHLKRVRASS